MLTRHICAYSKTLVITDGVSSLYVATIPVSFPALDRVLAAPARTLANLGRGKQRHRA